jgi:hypothetical protein
MTRANILTPKHLQTTFVYPLQQLLARAQLQNALPSQITPTKPHPLALNGQKHPPKTFATSGCLDRKWHARSKEVALPGNHGGLQTISGACPWGNTSPMTHCTLDDKPHR